MSKRMLAEIQNDIDEISEKMTSGEYESLCKKLKLLHEETQLMSPPDHYFYQVDATVMVCTISSNSGYPPHLIKKEPHECDFIVHSGVLVDPTQFHHYEGGFQDPMREGCTVTDIPFCNSEDNEPSDVMYIYNILRIKLMFALKC